MEARNKHGIRVKRCCRSCAFKALTRKTSMRLCTKQDQLFPRDHVCDDWTMCEALVNVGDTQGRVKCKEYLMHHLALRVEEQQAEEARQEVERKSAEEIRNEFETNHGSLFINI